MSSLLWWLSFIALVARLSEGFCPQGFGDAGFFPPEWKIPVWPQLELNDAANLHTVTLGGFDMANINEEYLEGPNDEFKMQGRETFWQASGKYFLYYCKRYDKWRIAEISAFSKNMDDNCFAFASDAYAGRDILNATNIKGWIEVKDGEWVHQKEAGVRQTGTLIDQMSAHEVEEDEEVAGEGNCSDAAGSDPFKEKDSACPVMPHVRKVKKKIIDATKLAGKWAQRLFPKLLGEASEEDAIPEADASGDAVAEAAAPFEGSCIPETQDGCNFKEKFYIEKQSKVTAEKRKSESERLTKLQDVAMKPDQVQWLHARIHILKHMVLKDGL